MALRFALTDGSDTQGAIGDHQPDVPVDELRRRDFAELARGDEIRTATVGKVVDLDLWQRLAHTRKMAAPHRQWPAAPLPGARPTVLTPADLGEWAARTGRRVTPEGTWWTALVRHAADYEWWTSQIEGRWADHLRPDLVDPAWVALYLSSISLSVPVRLLAEETADPGGLAVRRLADAGLITIATTRRGQWTYRTLPRLGNVGKSSAWDQPPGWPLP